jgi:GNAT superfamily N-acetyltransferase
MHELLCCQVIVPICLAKKTTESAQPGSKHGKFAFAGPARLPHCQPSLRILKDMNLTSPTASPCAAQAERIVFFEKCALMGVELLDLLDNYTLIVHDDDIACRYLTPAFPVQTFGNRDLMAAREPDMAVQRMLEDDTFLAKMGLTSDVPGIHGALLFRFQANQHLDALLQARKIALLVAPSALQERLGSKLYLPTLRVALGDALVPLVPSRVFDESTNRIPDGSAIFSACAAEWGVPFIVQGAQGVGGVDTFLLENAGQMVQVLAATQGQIRAARYIAQHISLSTHVCVGDGEPLIRGPYLQLVGLQELAAQAFRFCGNDTNQSLFDAAVIERVHTISTAIAQHVQAQGYVGIFGIDFIRDQVSGVLYVQELNMRMVGLTRLLTGMQKDQGMLPDLLAHLRAYGCTKMRTQMRTLADAGSAGHDYAQFMIRHHAPAQPSDQQVQYYLEPGIYQWQAGVPVKRSDSLFVADMVPGEWLVLMAAQPGTSPGPGDLLARIIVKESILVPGEYRVNPRFSEMIATVRSRILRVASCEKRSVQVRALALSDLAALEPILKAHVRDRHSGAIISAEVDAILRQMQGQADALGRVRQYWVAQAADGSVIACMAWAVPEARMVQHFMGDTAAPHGAIELLNAFVHPTLPGQGVGRALFDAICAQGRLANASWLWVNSGLRYAANWGFYDRVCDADHGFIDDFYGPGRPAKTWYKRLAG